MLGHEPNWPWRGHKADLYEGGHRTPLIAHWPAVIQPGQVCDHTICTTDLLATAADILGEALPEDAGEDSNSLMPLFRGDAIDGDFREATVHHSVSGHFAIRQGKWKLLEARGSGGWSYPKEDEAAKWGLPEVQLYDMDADPGECHNVAVGHAEVVERLQALLARYRSESRSAPRIASR
jgi:arylsulfatase A-like enzyme